MSRRPLSDAERRWLQQLGTTLRDLRREQGLLQEQLGARAGVEGTRIGEIERGEVDTSITRLRALSIGLQLPMWTILRRVDLQADEGEISLMRDRIVERSRNLSPMDLDLLELILQRFPRK